MLCQHQGTYFHKLRWLSLLYSYPTQGTPHVHSAVVKHCVGLNIRCRHVVCTPSSRAAGWLKASSPRHRADDTLNERGLLSMLSSDVLHPWAMGHHHGLRAAGPEGTFPRSTHTKAIFWNCVIQKCCSTSHNTKSYDEHKTKTIKTRSDTGSTLGTGHHTILHLQLLSLKLRVRATERYNSGI